MVCGLKSHMQFFRQKLSKAAGKTARCWEYWDTFHLWSGLDVLGTAFPELHALTGSDAYELSTPLGTSSHMHSISILKGFDQCKPIDVKVDFSCEIENNSNPNATVISCLQKKVSHLK